MKITLQNIENFSVIDEIHAGYIEKPQSAELKNVMTRAGGELNLKPVNLFKADLKQQMVLKCKASGTTYTIHS
ncbi:hypothetical protein THMIRHAS_18090 [Thiosulfatimonas sediminis]|uniref:Uncharacterized protein n=1 Tax=Thiosulfatimonas sediminis TaxID=2675054 RepID=A0A6F8PWG3_9GAMM|nr:hypothetical protein [Thiosulfatimonas sediminis]BBP46436.1 hypothetical protein THMIRHAS_18090 [Thiosulfatimonas sediminis]